MNMNPNAAQRRKSDIGTSTAVAPRILLVADDLQTGGVARVVLNLATALTESGRPVGLAAGPGGGMWNQVPTGCEIHPFPDGKGVIPFIKRIIALRSHVKTGRYDLIHAHQRGVALAARIATTGTPTTVIEHVHSIGPPRRIGRFVSFRGHVLVACGTAVAEMLTRDYGRRESRVTVVLNGIRDSGASSPRSMSSIVERPLRVIGAGRLSEEKDPSRFVRVIAALARVMPDGSVQATWYGDGPLRDQTESLITELGLTSILTLPGHREDLAFEYQHADLLLLTSHWEGLPLVALESLAAGCAIALPDVGSCRDAFGSEHVGFLYSTDTPDDELARLIRDELNPAQLATTAIHARARYLAAFTLERMVASMFDVYAAAWSPKSRP